MFGFFESDEKKADKFCAKGCMAILCGDHTEAIEHLQKAVELNPRHYEAWNNLGVVHGFHSYSKDRANEAKKCFEMAIRLKPDYQKAIRGLALVELSLGNFDQSLNLFRKLIKEFGYNPSKDPDLDGFEVDFLRDEGVVW